MTMGVGEIPASDLKEAGSFQSGRGGAVGRGKERELLSPALGQVLKIYYLI